MPILKDAMQAVMKKAIALAPDSFIPGGKPDPLIRHKHGLIGAPISRIDGPLKVSGRATFAAEFPMEGMTYAALKYSTIARGRIAEIDTAAAEAAPGVVLVMTYRNAPRLKPMPPFMTQPKAAGGDDVPIMQDDQIHWNGQPVALVLAETQEQADHAQSLIRVTYEAASDGVTSLDAAKANGSEPGVFQGEPLKLEIKDAEAMLAAAPHKVDVRYTTPRHNHNPIELHAATLAWEGDELRIHDTVAGGRARSLDHRAGVRDRREDRCTSLRPIVGGGFGSQDAVAASGAGGGGGEAGAAARAHHAVPRGRVPHRRRPHPHRTARGARRAGRRHARRPDPHRHGRDDAAQQHAGALHPAGEERLRVPKLPARRRDRQNEHDGQHLHAGAGRGGRHLRAGMRASTNWPTPWAWTPSNCASGTSRRRIRPRGCRSRSAASSRPGRTARERFGWDERSATPGARREGDWLVGMGCATGTYPYYRMPGGAARITLTQRRPRHRRHRRARDGHGHRRPPRPRSPPSASGCPWTQVDFEYADTILPGAVLAGGSQQTAAIGAAVIAAHHKLVKELLKLAGNNSPLAGLKPDEVGGLDGGLCALEDESRCESYASILARAQRDEVTVEAEAPMPLELQHWSMHSHSALFCEVRVNAVTGEMRVSRFLGSFDCGRIINAKTAASQFRGGIIMGLGLALMEETQFDERTGRDHEPLARRVSRAGASRRAGDRRDLDRRSRSAHARWARAASARSASPAWARRSPTRSSTPPASASAICRSRWTR